MSSPFSSVPPSCVSPSSSPAPPSFAPYLFRLHQLEEEAWESLPQRHLYATPLIPGFPWHTVITYEPLPDPLCAASPNAVSTSPTPTRRMSSSPLPSAFNTECEMCSARRHVVPYDFTFKVFTKGRWVGKSLLSVYTEEFPHHSNAYYQKCIAQGRLRRVTRAALRAPLGDIAAASSPTSSGTRRRTMSAGVPLSTSSSSMPRKNIVRRATKRCRALDGATALGLTRQEEDSLPLEETCSPQDTSQEGVSNAPCDRSAKERTGKDRLQRNPSPGTEVHSPSLSSPHTSSSSTVDVFSSTPKQNETSHGFSSGTPDALLLQHGDVILHTVHRHEIPVAMGTTGVDPVELIAVRIHHYGLLAVHKPSGIPTHATGRYHYNSAVAMLSYCLAPRRLQAWLVEENPLLQSIVATRSLSAREKDELLQYYTCTSSVVFLPKASDGAKTQEEEEQADDSTAEVSLEKAPRPCHRLDRATSGVLLMGVSEAATARLSTAFMRKTHAMVASLPPSPPPGATLAVGDPPPDAIGSPPTSAVGLQAEKGDPCTMMEARRSDETHEIDLSDVGVYKRYLARVQGQWGGDPTEEKKSPPAWRLTGEERGPAHPRQGPPWQVDTAVPVPFSLLQACHRLTQQLVTHATLRPPPNGPTAAVFPLLPPPPLFSRLASLPLSLGAEAAGWPRTDFPLGVLLTAPVQVLSDTQKEGEGKGNATAPPHSSLTQETPPTREWPAATVVQRLDGAVVSMSREVPFGPQEGVGVPPLLPPLVSTTTTTTTTGPSSHTDRGSLLLCLPLTGRLHQIRSHLRDYGHPILGEEDMGEADLQTDRTPPALPPHDPHWKGMAREGPVGGQRNVSLVSPTREVVYFHQESVPKGYARLQAAAMRRRSLVRTTTSHSQERDAAERPRVADELPPTRGTTGTKREEEEEPLCYECAHWLPLAVLPFPPRCTVSPSETGRPPPPFAAPNACVVPSPACPPLCLHAWSYTVEERLLWPHDSSSSVKTSSSSFRCGARDSRVSERDSRVECPSLPTTPRTDPEMETEKGVGKREANRVTSDDTCTVWEAKDAFDTEYCWRTTLPSGDAPQTTARQMDAPLHSPSSPSSTTWVTFCSGRIPDWVF